MYLHFKNKKYFPKGYTIVRDVPKIKKRINILRDGYSKKKIPNNIDVIVIGSGIGGLTLAGLLSKVGKKVLVLEQHYIAGGCCHTYNEHGYEFDTGIHYIGNIKKRQPVLDLITENPITWSQLGREDEKKVYDEIIINEDKYKFPTGEEVLKKMLIKKFPHEKEGIIEYFRLVKDVSKQDLFFKLKILRPKIFRDYAQKYLCKKYLEYSSLNTYKVIKSLIKDERLIAILCGQFGDIALLPEKSSFYIHASLVNHYFEGGYYPNGGPNEFARQIIPTIEKSGGRVLVRRKVDKIEIINSRAIGVTMENGDFIKSKYVVSDAGIRNTFTNLVCEPVFQQKYSKLLKNVKPSMAYFYVFIGFNKSNGVLDLPTRNIWIYPNENHNNLDKFYKDPINEEPFVFLAFPSAKDSTWSSRFPDKSTCVALTILPYDLFEKWENDKCTNRSDDYKFYKNEIAKNILNKSLFKYYPETKKYIDEMNIATGLSTKFYINSQKGECLGLEHTSERFMSKLLNPDTNVKNLFLTGQDIVSGGFTGALTGAILCAHSILGYCTPLDLLTGRNLISDLNFLELTKN